MSNEKTVSATKVQLLAVFLSAVSVIGIPLLVWGVNQQTKDAVQDQRIDTQDRSIDEVKQDLKETKNIALQILMELREKNK